MIIEDLTPENTFEQVQNDHKWIREVIAHEGQLYSHTAKKKAVELTHFLGENEEKFKVFVEYSRLREDLLKEINFNDHTKPSPGQIDMFSEEE